MLNWEYIIENVGFCGKKEKESFFKLRECKLIFLILEIVKL